MRGLRLIPYLLIAPSVVFLAVLFVYPLVQTVSLAFHADGVWSFAIFPRMADDLDFYDAIGNTLKLVAVVVPTQIVLALTMALMLGHVRRGRDLILWIWSIPLGISDLAAGLVWLAILTDRGYLNTVLFKLGLIHEPTAWLTYETPAALFVAILVAETWRATAIVFLILVAAVQLIPKEFAEAAEVFGAPPYNLDQFYEIARLVSADVLRTVRQRYVIAGRARMVLPAS
jgi:multiple sugar transport system permease protein